MPGERRDPLVTCGKVRGGISCTAGAQNARSVQKTLDEHDVETIRDHCDSPRCRHPYCNERWRSRGGARSMERLVNFENAVAVRGGQVGKVKHVAISVSDEESERAMARGPEYVLGKWLQGIWRELEDSGFYAAALIVHHVRSEQKTGGARRYHSGKNYVSLHVHAVGHGYLIDSREFYRRTGHVYVNKGARRDLAGTVSYLLDHALQVDGRHAIRYFGHVSYRNLKLVDEKKIIEVRACKCESQLWCFPRDETQPGEVNWRDQGFAAVYVHKVRTFEWIPKGWGSVKGDVT